MADKRVTQLTTAVQQLLQHGLKQEVPAPRAWMPSWRSREPDALLSILQVLRDIPFILLSSLQDGPSNSTELYMAVHEYMHLRIYS